MNLKDLQGIFISLECIAALSNQQKCICLAFATPSLSDAPFVSFKDALTLNTEMSTLNYQRQKPISTKIQWKTLLSQIFFTKSNFFAQHVKRLAIHRQNHPIHAQFISSPSFLHSQSTHFLHLHALYLSYSKGNFEFSQPYYVILGFSLLFSLYLGTTHPNIGIYAKIVTVIDEFLRKKYDFHVASMQTGTASQKLIF